MSLLRQLSAHDHLFALSENRRNQDDFLDIQRDLASIAGGITLAVAQGFGANEDSQIRLIHGIVSTTLVHLDSTLDHKLMSDFVPERIT